MQNIQLSEQAREQLLEQGFILGDSIGVPHFRDEFAVGLLLDNPQPPQKRFFGFVTIDPPKIFTGVLWFANPNRGANANKWVLEVYGQENFPKLHSLAKQLEQAFNVQVICNLVSAHVKHEYQPYQF